MKLKINKVHIRYEDDYFNSETPFSFGLVIDVSLSEIHDYSNLEIDLGVHWLEMEIQFCSFILTLAIKSK